jgi:anti-anti-sigma factor
MGIKLMECEGYRLVRITGFLDGHTSESRDLSELLCCSHHDIDNNHVLDLSAVEYVNSTMLGNFVRFLGSSQKNNFQVLILNPPPSVLSVLDLTGLSHVLPVVACEAEIMRVLGAGALPALPDEEVDYTALSSEIEDLIIRGEAAEGGGELERIVGS